VSKLHDIILKFIPYRLRDNEIWNEVLHRGDVEIHSGITYFIAYSLREFENDLLALKNVWDGERAPASSQIILEDRDVDRFITGYLQPWISQDPHLLNIILNVLQELKGTVKGLKLLAYILGVSDIEIFDGDSFTADDCPFPATLFHRYGMGGKYKELKDGVEYGDPHDYGEEFLKYKTREEWQASPACYPGTTFFDGTMAYTSMKLFSKDISTIYGIGTSYGDPFYYWHVCTRYGAGVDYGTDGYAYCSRLEYPWKCIHYGDPYDYGDDEVIYCEACRRDTCIPSCMIVVRIILNPDTYFDPKGFAVFVELLKRYLPACTDLAALFWVTRLEDEATVSDHIEAIPGDDVVTGLVYGSPVAYGDGEGYGGFLAYTNPPVYGYPYMYGDEIGYGGELNYYLRPYYGYPIEYGEGASYT